MDAAHELVGAVVGFYLGVMLGVYLFTPPKEDPHDGDE